MNEDVIANETQQWEKLVKNVLSREPLTASSAITMVAMAALKMDICDVILPGLDMF